MKKSANADFTNARPVSGRTTGQFRPRRCSRRCWAWSSWSSAAALEGGSATFDCRHPGGLQVHGSEDANFGRQDAQPAASYPAVVITEHEANAYLKVHSGEFLPAGVGTPSLNVQPEHAVASGDVDFDKLSRLYPNPNDMGPKILAAMFHGTQHVVITAKIQSESPPAYGCRLKAWWWEAPRCQNGWWIT